MNLYRCRVFCRDVNPLLTMDYAALANFLATKRHEKLTISCTDFWPQSAKRFLAGLVFSAVFACKVNFVANTCLRPQGHRNGLFQKPAKKVLYYSFIHQNVQNSYLLVPCLLNAKLGPCLRHTGIRIRASLKTECPHKCTDERV